MYSPNCERCDLHKEAESICVQGRGSVKAEVLFIGEAPGPDEDRKGRAFVGRSGKLLDRVMREYISDKEGSLKWRVSNVVRCFPGRNKGGTFIKPKAKHIKACREYLLAEIREICPRVIIALGGTAAKALCGDGRITKVRGLRFTWTDPNDPEFTLPVFPIFHPSFVLREERTRIYPWASDILNALTFLEEGEAEAPDYHLVESFGAAIELIDRIISLHESREITSISLDVETDGDKGGDPLMKCWGSGQILSVQLCWEERVAYMIPLHHPESPLTELEIKSLESAHLPRLLRAVPIYGQNIKYDCHWISRRWGIWPKVVFDTMLAHQVLFSGTKPNDLTSMSSWYVGMGGYDLPLRQFNNSIPKGTENYYRKFPLDILCKYGCGDVDAVFRLRLVFEEWLREENLERAMALVMGGFDAVARMEAEGFHVDRKVHMEMLVNYLPQNSGVAEQEFYCNPYVQLHEKKTGKKLNYGSPLQMREFFFGTLGCVPTRKTGKGEPSCDKQALQDIWENHLSFRPLIESLNRIRKAKKYYSTYILGLKRYLSADGRVRPSYKLEGTETGRLSAAKPPIHNIPRGSEIRRMFNSRHPDGLIMQMDFAQAELRVMAMLSKCDAFRGVFTRGEDPHRSVASAVFRIPMSAVTTEQRAIAKCFHPDTEVLTRSGWRMIRYLGKGEEVIQAIPEGGGVRLEWAVPLEVYTTHHPSGELVHLSNMGMDLRVTPDHRMLGFRKSGEHKDFLPGTIDKASYWVNAGVLPDSHDGGEWPLPDLLRLAVAVQADGSLTHQREPRVRFGPVEELRVQRLESLLSALGFGGSRSQWWLTAGEMTQLTLDRGGSDAVLALLDGKSFPWEWLSFPRELREVVLDEVKYWGGTQASAKTVWVDGYDRQSIDVLQALATLTGVKTRVTWTWPGQDGHQLIGHLSLRSTDRSRGGSLEVETMEYGDEVACLAVPSTYVLVRDGGVPVVTGQTVIFGLLYGRGAKAISEATVLDRREAQEFIDSMFIQLPGVKAWIDEYRTLGVRNNEVWTPFGRRRLLPAARFDGAEIERRAVNTPIQSSASDLTLMAGVVVSRKLAAMDVRTHLVSFIHDALVFDTTVEDLWAVGTMVKAVMETVHCWYEWAEDVPMVVDPEIGPSWGEKCKLSLSPDEGVFSIKGPMETFPRMKEIFRQYGRRIEMRVEHDEEKKTYSFVMDVRMID